jgi:hypothetical protein
MNRKLLNFLPLVLIVLFLYSGCGICTSCLSVNGILLSDFSATEADSVVVKIYQSSTNFTILLDSVVYAGVPATDSAGTQYLIPNATPLPYSSYNILIYIPRDNLTYKVTNITATTVACTKCPDNTSYITSITGYAVNGVSQTITNPSGVITITK